MTDKPSRIILHADDFGLSVQATMSVVRCIDRTAITSITVLANMPGTEHALKHALTFQDQVSVGVHLNLCEGRPLTTGHTLVDAGGCFHRKQSVIARALLKRLNMDELERELVAQVARVRDAGLAVSHFDGHKHLHVLPGINRVVARVGQKFAVERIRCPVTTTQWRVQSGGACALTFVRTSAARLARREFASAGLRSPHRFVELKTLLQPSRNGNSRGRLLRAPGLLTEVMCHPDRPGPDPRRPGALESDFLISDEFSCVLRDAEAIPCTYWEC